MNFGEAIARARRTGSHNERACVAESARCASPKRLSSAGEEAPREAPPKAGKLGYLVSVPIGGGQLYSTHISSGAVNLPGFHKIQQSPGPYPFWPQRYEEIRTEEKKAQPKAYLTKEALPELLGALTVELGA